MFIYPTRFIRVQKCIFNAIGITMEAQKIKEIPNNLINKKDKSQLALSFVCSSSNELATTIPGILIGDPI